MAPNPAYPTIRRRSRLGTAENITVTQRNRCADLTDFMMQNFKRRIAAKLRQASP
jgi:hypothetical protein